MILLTIIQFGAFVVITANAPIAPWWAAPAEHIIMALIVSLVPVAATVVRGFISHREHVQNLVEVQRATAGRDTIIAAVEQVHQEVKTGNALKLGEQSDANESRRIGQIAPDDRTEAERSHIEQIPERR